MMSCATQYTTRSDPPVTANSLQVAWKLAPATGLEPVTGGLTARCSSQQRAGASCFRLIFASSSRRVWRLLEKLSIWHAHRVLQTQ